MEQIDQIARRIKLRDLRTLLAVAESGNMSKAASRLAVSHPVVSKTIADLERTLGTRLFDRSSQGVEPTLFGRALVDCGIAIFDDLHRGLRHIEFLSDPAAGELRIGATGPAIDGLVLAAMEPLLSQYPRIQFHALEGDAATLYRALSDRKIDLAVSRTFRSNADHHHEFTSQSLFDEHLFVVAGSQSHWARRRKIELAELLDAPWVFPEYDNPAGALIAEGLRSKGVPLRARVISNSLAIRLRLVATQGFLTMLPGSMLHFGAKRLPVKALPVVLPIKSQKYEIVTLKNRTLSPVAKTFIETLCSVARPLRKGSWRGRRLSRDDTVL
jgi:DNA-binding transcriptional LysR family regulator